MTNLRQEEEKKKRRRREEEEKGLQRDLDIEDQKLLSDILQIDIMAGVDGRNAREKAFNTIDEIKRNIGSYVVEPEPRRRPEEAHAILDKLKDLNGNEGR